MKTSAQKKRFLNYKRKKEALWSLSRALLESNFPVTLTTFSAIWNSHPGANVYPCDKNVYPNQCAIRLGKAFDESGFSVSTFTGARCSKHNPGHIRGAQSLADWLRNIKRQGEPIILAKGGDRSQMDNSKGIVFIQNGWPDGGDHIDLWDDPGLAGGDSSWLDRGTLWFWKVT